jgi:hypothetical protein
VVQKQSPVVYKSPAYFPPSPVNLQNRVARKQSPAFYHSQVVDDAVPCPSPTVFTIERPKRKLCDGMEEPISLDNINSHDNENDQKQEGNEAAFQNGTESDETNETARSITSIYSYSINTASSNSQNEENEQKQVNNNSHDKENEQKQKVDEAAFRNCTESVDTEASDKKKRACTIVSSTNDVGALNYNVTVGNPMKGLAANPNIVDPNVNGVNFSVEGYYVLFASVVRGRDEYNLTTFEETLNKVIRRGAHTIPRFYIHYPDIVTALLVGHCPNEELHWRSTGQLP